MKIREKLPYLLIMPTLLIMILLIYYPIAVTLGYSFMNMKLTRPDLTGFVGLSNYINVLTDPTVWGAFYNSLIILLLVLIQTVIIGLGIAFLLKLDTPVSGILIAIAIIPWSLPPIVSGIIWRWMFHPSFGLINSILLHLHIIGQPIQWLNSHYLIILVVALSVAWRAIPLAALVLFSALQSIPSQLYEAAEIDGCNLFNRFCRITLPLLRPAMGIVLTTASITGINVFDELVSLAGYSSANSTLMMETYLRSFKFMDFGNGSALIYIVMLATGIISLFYVKRVYKEVEYI